MKIRLLLLVAGLAAVCAFAGGAKPPAAQAAFPPPCPVHPIVGQNSHGVYVWPPGCGGPIYTNVTIPPT